MTTRGSELSRRVAERFAQLRHESGLSLEEVADRAGVHRTTLGLIEKGRRRMTLDLASDVAEALGTSLLDVLSALES